jgi:hypothetical protein
MAEKTANWSVILVVPIVATNVTISVFIQITITGFPQKWQN